MGNKFSKKTMVLMLLFTIALVLTVLMFVNSKTAPRSSFIMDGRKKLAVAAEVEAVSNSSSLLHCVRDLLVEAQEGNLRAKNLNGKVAWSQKLPARITDIEGAGENIVIIDSGNNIYYYSMQGKLLWTYKSTYEIVDLFTEDNGSLLAEYKGLTGSHAEAFSQNGAKLGSVSVENAHILSFTAGEGRFSISVLDTSAEAIKTRIITYDPKGDIIWAKDFENKIIAKLNYNKSNRLLAIGENEIYSYGSDGNLQSEVVIDGEAINVAMDDYHVVLVAMDKGKLYSVCLDADLREKSRLELERAPLGLYPSQNNIIMYYNDELMVLTEKGELTARFKSNSEISSLYTDAGGSIYLVSNRKLQRLDYVK
ncbi:MAG: DUF5711 family protein [Pseudomonadota bacterium]